MTTIVPSIGRVVLFRPATDLGHGLLETPFAATVAYVNEDGTINLSVCDHAGNQFAQQNVPLIQDGEDFPDDGSAYAYWMPYQIATAAASEAKQEAKTPIAGAAGSSVKPL